MIKKTTVTGAEYTLEKANGGWQWKGKGVLPKKLDGIFSTKHVAFRAFNGYDGGLVIHPNTGADELEALTKKADLLGYAINKGIEIPDEIKQPAAIKKYLEGLENA